MSIDPKKLPSLIEMIREYRYLLILCIFAVYTDLFLIHVFGFGLLKLKTDLVSSLSSVGWLFIYIFILSFYLAIIVPLLVYIFNILFFLMPDKLHYLLSKGSIKDRQYKIKNNNFRSYKDLIKESISEKNEVKFNLAQQKNNARNKYFNKEKQLSFLSFSLLILILVGLLTTYNQEDSLIFWSYFYLTSYSEGAGYINNFIALISWYFLYVLIHIGVFHQFFFEKDDSDYIYFPYGDSSRNEIKRQDPKFN